MDAEDLELYGITELATRFNLSRQAVYSRAQHSKALARPRRLACGTIWTGSQANDFGREIGFPEPEDTPAP